MEKVVTGIGLFILRNLIEHFALAVNYLQKGIEKVSWQMRVKAIRFQCADICEALLEVPNIFILVLN
jgi:hypothetical protein